MNDQFGFIDETYFSLDYPRIVDESYPTLAEAVTGALEAMNGGAEKASVVAIGSNGQGMPVEKHSMTTMTRESGFDVYADEV